MTLSPIDVQQQTFRVALRGYAEDEVDDFLDQVVISLRDYEQKLRDAEERITVLEEQLAANRETEDAMKRAFVAAQRTADTIVTDAREEATKIVADARVEAEQLSHDQREEKASLLSELSMLRERVGSVRRSAEGLASGIIDEVAPLHDEIVAVSERYGPLQPVEDDLDDLFADTPPSFDERTEEDREPAVDTFEEDEGDQEEEPVFGGSLSDEDRPSHEDQPSFDEEPMERSSGFERDEGGFSAPSDEEPTSEYLRPWERE